MTQPAVIITQLDGALGVLPPSSGRLYAVVGPSSTGPVGVPSTFGRKENVASNFGIGGLVEAAAHYIEKYGRPVLVIRTGNTVAGAAGTVDTDGVSGTSVVTADDVATEPLDDYEVYFVVKTGGTIGTDGIVLQHSLDNGRTLSPPVALGTAETFTIPNSGVTVDFAAGTLLAGDEWSFRTTAPKWDNTELAAALDALKNNLTQWEIAHIVGPIDAADVDTIETKFAGMAAVGKYHAWTGNTRMPDEDESEATYLSSLSTAFAAKATTYGALCSGAQEMTSSVSGRRYRRPVSYVYGALEASVSEEINVADPNLGALPVSIRDVNGNPLHHDESVNPGLDDARFTVLRTWDGLTGVYVNRPRLFSAEGSDFQLMPHRRVFNLGLAALRIYFIRRTNRPVRVSKSTGFILEEEALEIETGALKVMRSVLLAKPKASGVQFILSRMDNLLSTKTLTGDARIIPLSYPETIQLTVGFLNPALQVQAV